MKIRIKGDTVRYRLSKPEVVSLAHDGVIEEKTEFITNSLVYQISQTDNEDLSADFAQNKITLYVPQIALQQWATTEQIGIEGTVLLPNGSKLYLLLEKDFKCIDANITEDQSDYFENPYSAC